MNNYQLKFVVEPYGKSSPLLPKDLIDAATEDQFGQEVTLVFSLIKLRANDLWERTEEDMQKGAFYSPIVILNLQSLTEAIDVDFLAILIDEYANFELDKIGLDTRYSLNFSLRSPKEVMTGRGAPWYAVSVVSVEYKDNMWTHDQSELWNSKEWTQEIIRSGCCEMKAME